MRIFIYSPFKCFNLGEHNILDFEYLISLILKMIHDLVLGALEPIHPVLKVLEPKLVSVFIMVDVLHWEGSDQVND